VQARLYYEPSTLVMKSVARIAKGDEIFNDYGPLPRSDLLRRYGYVTDNYAQYDVVEISLDLVTQIAREEFGLDEDTTAKRVAYLEEIGALEDDSFDLQGEGTDLFPESLKLLVLLLSISAASFSTIQSDVKGGKRLLETIKKNDFPLRWYQLLGTVLTRRAAEYESSLVSDQESLAKLALDTQEAGGMDKGARRKMMALQVRIGEKEILAKARLALKELDERSQKAREGTETKKRTADEGEDVEMGGTKTPSSAKRRK
jgi:SET domain-containing protein 6